MIIYLHIRARRHRLAECFTEISLVVRYVEILGNILVYDGKV